LCGSRRTQRNVSLIVAGFQSTRPGWFWLSADTTLKGNRRSMRKGPPWEIIKEGSGASGGAAGARGYKLGRRAAWLTPDVDKFKRKQQKDKAVHTQSLWVFRFPFPESGFDGKSRYIAGRRQQVKETALRQDWTWSTVSSVTGLDTISARLVQASTKRERQNAMRYFMPDFLIPDPIFSGRSNFWTETPKALANKTISLRPFIFPVRSQ
jgi:hypothetical protein